MVDDPLVYMGNITLLIAGENDATLNPMSGTVLFLNQFHEKLVRVRGQPELVPFLVSGAVCYHRSLP